MRKKFALVMAALLLVGLIAGCAADGDAVSTTTPLLQSSSTSSSATQSSSSSLVTQPTSSAAIALALSIAKQSYSVGESVEFRCTGGEGTMLVIYYPDGSARQFPNVGLTKAVQLHAVGVYSAVLIMETNGGVAQSALVAFIVQAATTTKPTTTPTTAPTTTPTTAPTTAPTTTPTTTPTISGALESEAGATLKIMIPGHNPKNNTLWQNQVIRSFMMQYPNVTVQFVTSDWSNWEEKLLAAYYAGDPIDLIYTNVNSFPKYSLVGLVQPLQNYVNMNNPNLHIDSMQSCFLYGDNYYVAASETSFGVIYYNKNLFQAAGLEDPMSLYEKGEWTWANFVRAAKKLTNKDEEKWGFATEFPYLFYGSNATSTLKLDANGKYELNMDDPAFAAALSIIKDGWVNSGWSGWEGTALSSFQTGTSAMLGSFTMYEGEINSLHYFYPELYPAMNYGVVPLPKGPNNPEGLNMVYSAGWSIGVDSDCPNHVGKLIDMLVDGNAQSAHVALYKEMSKKTFCVNTRDSAIGGGYALVNEVANGTSITQAIEQYKPIYQNKINEINYSIPISPQ